MLLKTVHYIKILLIVVFSVNIVNSGWLYADFAIEVMTDPPIGTINIETPQEIILIACTQAQNLQYHWQLIGRGRFVGDINSPGILYIPPDKITHESEEVIVTVIVTDSKGKAIKKSVNFTLTNSQPQSLQERTKLNQLLETAEIYFKKTFYIVPKGHNAFEAYKEVLSIDPTHQLAQERIRQMAENYKEWRDVASENGDYTKAKRYDQRYQLIFEYIVSEFEVQSTQLTMVDSQPPKEDVVETKFTATPTPAPTPTSTPFPQKPVLQEKKLALVIGNSSYPEALLKNPVNDARMIALALQKLGFEVRQQTNSTQRDMKKAIDTFGQQLKQYDVGLFYYSGHGLQVRGQNYLVPIDASPKSENDVEYDCVNAGRILGKMEDARTTNILILDACRNNPFERSWTKSATGNGLAFVNAPLGSLIAYATAPGTVAFDNPAKQHSPYTEALLKHMTIPNITILELFQRVRRDVIEVTKQEQIPWESTSLTGNFYLTILRTFSVYPLYKLKDREAQKSTV